MIALLLSTAFAAFTVNIEGVGTFRQNTAFTYNNNIVDFTGFTCVKADIFTDDFEPAPKIFFRAGNGILHPLKTFNYNGHTLTLNMKALRAVSCIQNPGTLDEIEKMKAALRK